MLKAVKADNELQILSVDSSETSAVLEKGPDQRGPGPKVSSHHTRVRSSTKATFPLF